MRIFVSSTIYDLIDVRAELKEMFDNYEVESCFSEMNDSRFIVDYLKSSIETCLLNVLECDYFIIILSKRYGSSLKDSGYEDISATHLEYREAVKNKKKILFFIRENTFSDYSVYRKTADKKSFGGTWVEKKDFKLFELIDEHSLLKDKDKNNWLYKFTNSVDLKKIIRKNIETIILEENLGKRIALNELPNLIADFKIEKRPSHRYEFLVIIKNAGKTSAFVKKIEWENHPEPSLDKVLLPDEIFKVALYPGNLNNVKIKLFFEYSSYDGITIKEHIDIKCTLDLELDPSGLGTLVDFRPSGKKYFKGEPIKVKLN